MTFPARPQQHATRSSPVGVDINAWMPGFFIGGFSINNPTLSWLAVDAASGIIFVPPLTLGFSSGLAVAKDSISVKFVPAPFGGSASVASGDPISITAYEIGANIASYAGNPMNQVYQMQDAVLNATSAGSSIGTAIAMLAAPGVGFRYRIWHLSTAITFLGDLLNSALFFGFTMQVDFQETPANTSIDVQGVDAYSIAHDQTDFVTGRFLTANSGVRIVEKSNMSQMDFLCHAHFTIEAA